MAEKIGPALPPKEKDSRSLEVLKEQRAGWPKSEGLKIGDHPLVRDDDGFNISEIVGLGENLSTGNTEAIIREGYSLRRIDVKELKNQDTEGRFILHIVERLKTAEDKKDIPGIV